MKRRLGVVAVISLLCGLASGGLAVRSYFRAREQADLFPGLQRKSIELEEQSDAVKGTPEEQRLIEESRRYDQAAALALASKETNRRWAMILGVGGILLILLSVALMMMHLKRKEAGSTA
ncbi:MAG TPA: hypothetical protein VJT09_19730 [Pyrinomonadaceae bacterium]|nr:hypothetical protein [Pyrinomonadaceae bacterium]